MSDLNHENNYGIDINIEDAFEKERELKSLLRQLGSVAVAFSGGVDSTYLLKVAHDVLGDRAIAITASLHSFPKREFDEAVFFCEKEGIEQVRLSIDEFSIDGFRKNPVDRCYHCKKHIFTNIIETASSHGIAYVADGSNVDDDGDYRPGHRAIQELHVVSPLRKAGMTKNDIRFLSERLGLSSWNKPSMACLASRFVYGEEITREKLSMVDRGESLLREMGFSQYRVRIHGLMARIEIPENEFSKIMEDNNRKRIKKEFKNLGFSYVTLDLEGFRSGSMNQNIEYEERMDS